jgi:Chalcone isomerase-like
MKKKTIFLMCFIVFGTISIYSQKQFETEGIIVPRYIGYQEKKIELNGFGTRSKLWIDVYVQALYLSKLSQDPKEIIESNTEMGIRIQIISSLVTSKKLSKALNKGLKKSVGEENITKIQTEVDLLDKMLSDQPTKEKDFFNLIYNPNETSVFVYKNDILLGKIPGFEFKKAFFGIWLSENPVDADLKNDLLGKS